MSLPINSNLIKAQLHSIITQLYIFTFFLFP